DSMAKNILMVLGLTSAFLATAAFADEILGDKEGEKAGEGKPGIQRSITFEEFKGRCEHPHDYPDVQTPPMNIPIRCSDASSEFVASTAGSFPLEGTRQVTSAVYSHKFNIAAESRGVPVYQKAGSCLVFKEVAKTLTIERPLNCAEILGKGFD